MTDYKTLKIQITNYISNDFPGFVECKFKDAWGKEHTIHEKLPVISLKNLDEKSNYPVKDSIACEIIKEWKDQDNRLILSITTNKPWGIETVEELTEFDILTEQLINLNE